MLSTNKLFQELQKDFPDKATLLWWYKKDVERGADGETVYGYLLDHCKDVYCMPKPDASSACLKLINKYFVK